MFDDTNFYNTFYTQTQSDTKYQTITNMINSLTTTVAASTYQTITNMTNYLTTTVAASTYASKTATTDQSFAANVVIGTGKALTTPAITLNGSSLSSTLTGKADIAGATFTGNVAGITQATSDSSTKFATTAYVQSNLANYQLPIWACGYVGAGGNSVTANYGQSTVSVSSSSGTYSFTLGTSVPSGNSNYAVVASIWGPNAGFITTNATSSNAFQIKTMNTSGTPVSSYAMYLIVVAQ